MRTPLEAAAAVAEDVPPVFDVPLQLTILTCLPALLITMEPTGALALPVPEGAPVDDDVADDEVGTTVTLDNHEFCLTTITPGRHCWCCWRICDAVC